MNDFFKICQVDSGEIWEPTATTKREKEREEAQRKKLLLSLVSLVEAVGAENNWSHSEIYKDINEINGLISAAPINDNGRKNLDSKSGQALLINNIFRGLRRNKVKGYIWVLLAYLWIKYPQKAEIFYTSCKLNFRHREVDIALQNVFVEGDDKWLSPYNKDNIPFVGRETEIEQLNSFANDEASFKIWSIIAPSGAGKTRLTVHWAFELDTLIGWKRFFLNQKDRENSDFWNSWNPNQPTLIIIDYMFGYDDVIKNIVTRCSQFLNHSVRLLVLDHTMLDPSIRIGGGVYHLVVEHKIEMKNCFLMNSRCGWII